MPPVKSWAVDFSEAFGTFSGSTSGRSFTAELWGTNRIDGGPQLSVSGSNRLFLTNHKLWVDRWRNVDYHKLDLLGRSLSFDVDLSAVGKP